MTSAEEVSKTKIKSYHQQLYNNLEVTYTITGSRNGMTDKQKEKFRQYVKIAVLVFNKKLVFKHGDCIGVDDDAHNIIINIRKELDIKHVKICIHPPTYNKYRAYCDISSETDKLEVEERYLDRNKTMVDGSLWLVAFPDTMEEQYRGGTWSTIRYARKYINKPWPFYKRISTIFPDGSIKLEGY